MPVRSKRNKTITLNTRERALYSKNLLELSSFQNPEYLANKIINQDIFKARKFLPSNFVDLFIVDPPYNLTKSYNGNIFREQNEFLYQQWIELWFADLIRILKKDASVYVCCDWKSSNAVYNVIKKYLLVHNRITWEREKGRGAKNNWKNCSEDIWFATVSKDFHFNPEAVKLKRKVLATYRSEDGSAKGWHSTNGEPHRLTYASNLWTDITVPFWSMPENTIHPTQKPEKLIAKIILASSEENDFVFDPFGGSGTTAVVAKKLNRKYCSVEVNREYCLIAEKRLAIAQTDKSIQGYSDGVFWERNSVKIT